MSLKIGNELVGTLKIGNELVSVAKIGNEIIYRRGEAPPRPSGLYMVDTGAGAALYEVNRTTGAATRVGSAVDFDASVNRPLAMTWDGTSLVMFVADFSASTFIGIRYNSFRLDHTTGMATLVQDAEFSSDILDISGLAWDGTDLWGIDGQTSSGSNRLYKVNIVEATRFDIQAAGFGIGLRRPRGIAWDGTNMYLVAQKGDVGGVADFGLFTVDRDGGVASAVDVDVDNFGLSQSAPSGLAWDGTNLYMNDLFSDALYTLDRDTGLATRVGSAVQYGVSVSLPVAIAWVPPPPPPPEAQLSIDTLTLTSRGSTATYTLVLNRDPEGNVTIMPTSSSDSAATVSDAVTFTSDNWETPQEITVTAIEEGSVTISHAVTASTSDIYPTTFTIDSISVTVDLPARVALSTDTVSMRDEDTSTYTLRLDTQPTSSVVITPTSSSTATATVSGAVTFTSDNWSVPQEVTVTGTGEGSTTITHAITSSSDTEYTTSLAIDSVSVTVIAKLPPSTMYMSTDVGELYTLDRTTGSATLLASVSLPNNIDGIASDGERLYLSGSSTDGLWYIDLATKQLVKVPNSPRNFGISENQFTGMAWDGTDLYVVGISSQSLYRVDRATGRGTRVGTASRFNAGERFPAGLAWDGTNLYMAGGSNTTLYTLDRTTGRATRAGDYSNRDLGNVIGLAWDGTTMYIISNRDPRGLFTIDRISGTVTKVGSDDFSEVGGVSGLAWSLTPTS